MGLVSSQREIGRSRCGERHLRLTHAIYAGIQERVSQQLELPIQVRASWGGSRRGAGRPKTGEKSARIPHLARPRVSVHRPHHVTVKMARGTWNLRSQRCFAPIRRALAEVRKRPGFRVVQFTVQHNHLHLLVEAEDRRTMSNALRALLIRVARGLNAVMGTRGRRVEDRYHEHVLKTPTEVRNALRHVLGNRAHHLAQRGARAADAVDEYSSQAEPLEPLVRPPRSWLLRQGWMKAAAT
jgi:REP element-mobilizing transposase RayT